MLKFLSFKSQFIPLDSAQGIAEHIVAVFGNVDEGGDCIVPGAFKSTLAERRNLDGSLKLKGCWCHDATRPIAKTLDAQELLPGDTRLPDALKPYGGLWVKVQYNLETEDGKQAFSNVANGYVDEFSIGYSVKPNGSSYTDKGVRLLSDLELYEWSPVLAGMNPLTVNLAAKARLLRKSGRVMSASNHAAMKAILSDAQDSHSDLADCLEELDDFLDALLGETEPDDEAQENDTPMKQSPLRQRIIKARIDLMTTYFTSGR